VADDDEPKDPSKPLVGKALRALVIKYITSGRVTFSDPHALKRLKERKVTADEALSALRSGALRYESTVYGRCRYTATKGKLEIVFTFQYGLIVITIITSGRR
jgi:hypothetical protein